MRVAVVIQNSHCLVLCPGLNWPGGQGDEARSRCPAALWLCSSGPSCVQGMSLL